MQKYISVSDAVVFDRRQFIDRALKGFGAVALGSYTITFLQACSESDSPTGPGSGGDAMITIDLSLPENTALNNIGGSLALSGNSLDEAGILLYRVDNQTIRAFSRLCPHQGCSTGAFSNGVSTCPCHSSKFNTDGSVIQGPAPSGLRQYSVTIEGDIVTIK